MAFRYPATGKCFQWQASVDLARSWFANASFAILASNPGITTAPVGPVATAVSAEGVQGPLASWPQHCGTGDTVRKGAPVEVAVWIGDLETDAGDAGLAPRVPYVTWADPTTGLVSVYVAVGVLPERGGRSGSEVFVLQDRVFGRQDKAFFELPAFCQSARPTSPSKVYESRVPRPES